MSKLKEAHIIPIHKEGHHGLAGSYRRPVGIALTSHIIKVFQKVVRKRIVQFLEDNNKFNNGQHGFRVLTSC